MRGVRVDLSGRAFGRLVVDGFSHAKDRRRFYLCTCSCGTKVVKEIWSLLGGHTKSCGCLRRELAIKKGKDCSDPRGRSFALFLDRYRQSAKKRSLSFRITADEFAEISIQECFYCGAPPVARRHVNVDHRWVGNGLDRVDNSRGYEIENVVPCCERCNRMKMDMTLEEFRSLVARVHQRFNGGSQ